MSKQSVQLSTIKKKSENQNLTEANIFNISLTQDKIVSHKDNDLKESEKNFGRSQTLSKRKEEPPIAKVTPVSRSPDPEDALNNSTTAWNAMLDLNPPKHEYDYDLASKNFAHSLNSFKEERSPAEISYLASLYMTGFPYFSACNSTRSIASLDVSMEKEFQFFGNKSNTFPTKLTKCINLPSSSKFHPPMDFSNALPPLPSKQMEAVTTLSKPAEFSGIPQNNAGIDYDVWLFRN